MVVLYVDPLICLTVYNYGYQICAALCEPYFFDFYDAEYHLYMYTFHTRIEIVDFSLPIPFLTFFLTVVQRNI